MYTGYIISKVNCQHDARVIFFLPAEIGGNSSISQMPSWTPPAITWIIIIIRININSININPSCPAKTTK